MAVDVATECSSRSDGEPKEGLVTTPLLLLILVVVARKLFGEPVLVENPPTTELDNGDVTWSKLFPALESTS